jgi:uncharacterized protein involved in exopolysaccharide biosynthesis
MPRVIRFFRTGLREKPRVAIAVGVAVFAATAFSTFTRPKIYEATTAFDVKRSQVIRITAERDTSSSEVGIVCGEKLNTYADVIESTLMARRVAKRISPSDAYGLLAYSGARSSEVAADEILVEALKRSRRVYTTAPGQQIRVSVRHPDPVGAARIANLYSQEMYAWLKRFETEGVSRGIEELAMRIRQTREHIQEMEAAITAYRAQVPANPATSATEGSAEGTMARSLEANRGFLDQLVERHTAVIKDQSHILDDLTVIPAEIPALDAYVEPSHPRDLGAGLIAGCILGVSAAAFAARAKRPAASETVG